MNHNIAIGVISFIVVAILYAQVCKDDASLTEVERRRSRNPETVE